MKKEITALKDLVEHRKSLIHGLQDKSRTWNVGNEPLCINFVEIFTDFLSKEIQYLEKIIQYGVKQKSSTCKHPKIDHDACGGILYCMNCNYDLV